MQRSFVSFYGIFELSRYEREKMIFFVSESFYLSILCFQFYFLDHVLVCRQLIKFIIFNLNYKMKEIERILKLRESCYCFAQTCNTYWIIKTNGRPPISLCLQRIRLSSIHLHFLHKYSSSPVSNTSGSLLASENQQFTQ